MPPTALVRDATLEDTSAIGSLLSELGYESSCDQVRMRLRRLMGRPEYATFVAEANRTIVGMLGVRSGFHYAADGRYAQIIALIVTASFRNRGIGRLLVGAVEQWAKSSRVEMLVVNTGLQRDDAHRFYESLAFEHTGRRYVKLLE